MPALSLGLLVALVTPLIIGKKIIKYLKAVGIVGIDQHKKDKPVIASSGGTIVATGVFSGLLTFIALSVFVTKANINLLNLMAALLTVQTITVIGFLDDIYLNKKPEKDKSGEIMLRRGLSQLEKTVLLIPAAIPLMAVNAGVSSMILPFIGKVQFGLLYPLILVPIGVVCVASAVNMLGGFNGLEASMGAIALTGIGVFALMNNSVEAAAIALTGAAALIAFLKFNFYPAKVLPGDSLTYLIGALIASSVIIGNIERFGVIVFTPWIIEAFIKAKQRFRATCLARVDEKGLLHPKNDKIESLTHLMMKLFPLTERRIVVLFAGIEALCVAIAFVLC